MLVAGPGVPGAEIVAKQTELYLQLLGATESQITGSLAMQRALIATVRESSKTAKTKAIVEKAVESFLAELPKEKREAARPQGAALASLENMATPWFRFFVDHDPRPVLKKVRCPVLALWGELDIQVVPDQNLPEIQKALQASGNSNYKVVVIPRLNHLLQTAKTGSPAEYGTIEETIAPVALNTIADWILTVVDSAK